MMGPFKSFWQLTPVKCESGGGYRRQPFRRTAAQRILFPIVFLVGERKNCLNAWPRLNWYRTRASSMRDQRLSAWVMGQAVSRRLLNVEVQLRSQFFLRCMVDKMILRRVFSEYFGFPCQYHTTDASTHHLHFALTKRTNGQSLGKVLSLKKKRNAIFNRLFH